MLRQVTPWLYILLGIIAVVFFFLPFSVWNWIAASGLTLFFLVYLVKAFRYPTKYTRPQKVEFSIYTVLLTAMFIILVLQDIPLFARVFFLGLIGNLLVRVIR